MSRLPCWATIDSSDLRQTSKLPNACEARDDCMSKEEHDEFSMDIINDE